MMFPMPDAVFKQHTIVLGKTRSGKSSKMRLMVERLLDVKHPVCIIDPKGDWWGLKSSADGKKAGYPVIIFGGEHADVPINEHAGAHVAELIATGNRPCIIDLGGWMVGARTRFFIDFASTLFKLTKGARWLVIDECHNFAPQGRIMDPDAGKMLHWANRLASEGAGKGLTLISASQRPQKVHKDYVTSHETLIATRVIHKLDRDAVKDWIDGCADPAKGKEVMGELAGMNRSEAWVWSPEIGFGPVRVDFPMFKTYDSFKPQGHDAPATLKGWASIDLDDVKAKLATVVEEAKQNDPKALKAEIARLKADLAKAPKAAAPAPDRAYERTIDGARKEGFGEGFFQGWGEGDKAGWERGIRQANKGWEAAIKAFAVPFCEYVPQAAPRRAPTPSTMPVLGPKPPAAREVANSAPRAPRSNGHDTGLPTPHRRVLAALSFWASAGHPAPTREQVAGVAGYSPGSGGFNNILGALATAGMIDKPQPGRVGLSDAAPHIEMTAEDAKQKLWSVLSGPERKIVDALDGDTSPVDREEVAKRTGYSAGSGGFNNLLGHLCTLTVLEKPRAGHVALSEWAAQVLTA